MCGVVVGVQQVFFFGGQCYEVQCLLWLWVSGEYMVQFQYCGYVGGVVDCIMVDVIIFGVGLVDIECILVCGEDYCFVVMFVIGQFGYYVVGYYLFVFECEIYVQFGVVQCNWVEVGMYCFVFFSIEVEVGVGEDCFGQFVLYLVVQWCVLCYCFCLVVFDVEQW